MYYRRIEWFKRDYQPVTMTSFQLTNSSISSHSSSIHLDNLKLFCGTPANKTKKSSHSIRDLQNKETDSIDILAQNIEGINTILSCDSYSIDSNNEWYLEDNYDMFYDM